MIERFLSHTTPEPNSGCFLWMGVEDEHGYGRFYLANEKGKRRIRAHRFSYKMFVGEIPAGHCVMHKCDNRRCVAPNHLTTGTWFDNSKDMYAKGRGVWVKLTYAKAQEIRMRCAAGESKRALAKEFLIDRTTIRDLLAGKSWCKER